VAQSPESAQPSETAHNHHAVGISVEHHDRICLSYLAERGFEMGRIKIFADPAALFATIDLVQLNVFNKHGGRISRQGTMKGWTGFSLLIY
jgi:hypothetical protein